MTAADRGLQAQRTALSWTRTAFAVLGNGALLMLHDIGGHRAGFGLVAAGVAVAIAVLVFLVGVRRQRALAGHPLPSRITPAVEVHLVTAGVLILIVVSVLSLPR
ncbi:MULTISPECIES: DUF202 domain-containing protein [unclassified Mycolicibacterium]|uniref:DUF202 domain-containing protein n=1 Tax=unclassified Mycolicibacterium TaxID=2636767 RepID=UPI00130586A4|nr:MULTISPECIES: DUF202 domain-containing protein [unclassified Mycolicibacterium]MUL80644.1 DUF202 domain-containing protein [Mycolicibacterium sp. CBMA 329]MUL86411.1 DUF202 domain-containing protein [Mycolicibacterium sp. CBMA 331]MUM01273.1 DUF202 domain-containing protein [Mycolicibacterium sp. CBMA 334]MUM27699.1 DUF202 domain-containing protein [Mycolicibacterium sp. CBMA 295]MUM36707.1 DUF202 domain-containing protein [Mycolicibacterium sp. CBMA 247]